MQLLTVLACGLPAAANGTANLYKRGTSTTATWYSNYDGSGANGSGSVSLDSYGGATAYVNECVDVEVLDSLGNTVREYTEMHGDSSVEVFSSSFTGTDYVSGASAAGNPAALQAVLDLWKTKNKAIDWQVKVGSTTATLPVWLGQFVGLFFNPLDETYGAVGDGTADDTSAVQAAITAANAAGGGTVVITASHRLTAALTVPAGVDIMGVNAAVAQLWIDDATANALTYTGATVSGRQVLRGVTVAAMQANSGAHVYVHSAATRLSIENCEIGGTYTDGWGVYSDNASGDVQMVGCTLTSPGSSTSAVAAYGGTLTMVGGIVKAASGACGVALVDVATCRFTAVGTTFNNAPATSGTMSDVYCGGANAFALLLGCRFTAGGGATVSAIGDGDGTIETSGCVFAAAAATYDTGLQYYNSRTGTSDETVPSDRYRVGWIHTTDGGSFDVVCGDPIYPGQRMSLVLYNSSGVNSTMTFTGTSWAQIGAVAVNAATYVMVEVVAAKTATVYQWIPADNGAF